MNTNRINHQLIIIFCKYLIHANFRPVANQSRPALPLKQEENEHSSRKITREDTQQSKSTQRARLLIFTFILDRVAHQHEKNRVKYRHAKKLAYQLSIPLLQRLIFENLEYCPSQKQAKHSTLHSAPCLGSTFPHFDH